MSEKLNIHWFPGHMTKAKRQMEASLAQVDCVIELRDARIPNASENPMLKQLLKNKKRIILLTKKDLANPNETKKWIDFLMNEDTRVVSLNVLKDNTKEMIKTEVTTLMQPMIDRQIRRGMKPRAIRCMVAGIPNVGKSTLINQIVKKKVAVAGNMPGVTKALQWVKVDKTIELLDTPGVLWPKIEEEQVAIHLAIIGSIKDSIIPINEIAYKVMNILIQEYPKALESFYEVEVENDMIKMFEKIAYKRGYLLSNREVDEKRLIDAFMKDIRSEKFYPITWEKCDGIGE